MGVNFTRFIGDRHYILLPYRHGNISTIFRHTVVFELRKHFT